MAQAMAAAMSAGPSDAMAIAQATAMVIQKCTCAESVQGTLARE